MHSRYIITTILSLVIVSGVFAQESFDQLHTRIDSLETWLEKLQELNHNNPYTVINNMNWGKGFFMGGKTGANYTMNLELGYMWKTGNDPEVSLSEHYIGKRSDYRWGFSGGAQYFKSEPVYKNDDTFYTSTAYGPYMKFNFASPVLLNFISFSCHLKAMYAIPTDDNEHNITDNKMVYGYGYDVEFWVTEHETATLGFTDESDSFFGGDSKNPIYPSKIRFVFGFKKYF